MQIGLVSLSNCFLFFYIESKILLVMLLDSDDILIFNVMALSFLLDMMHLYSAGLTELCLKENV